MRPTKEIDLGDGHKAVIKAYSTVREDQELQKIYMSGAKVQLIENRPNLKDYDVSVQFSVEHKMIELFVESLDGVKENILARLLDELPKEIYSRLIGALDEATRKEAKKN